MKYINLLLLLIILTMCILNQYYSNIFSTNVLKFEDTILNAPGTSELRYKGTPYSVYTMKKIGIVKDAYEVYVPIYMASSTREQLIDEVNSNASNN